MKNIALLTLLVLLSGCLCCSSNKAAPHDLSVYNMSNPIESEEELNEAISNGSAIICTTEEDGAPFLIKMKGDMMRVEFDIWGINGIYIIPSIENDTINYMYLPMLSDKWIELSEDQASDEGMPSGEKLAKSLSDMDCVMANLPEEEFQVPVEAEVTSNTSALSLFT